MDDRRVENREALTYCAVAVEVTMETLPQRVGDAVEEIERYMGSRGIEATGPSLIRYRDVAMDRPFVVEVGWVIDEGQWIEAPYIADVLPAGSYAVATHRGPYEDLTTATSELLEWVTLEGLDMAVETGESDVWDCWYELYLTDPVWGTRGPEGTVEICLKTADEGSSS